VQSVVPEVTIPPEVTPENVTTYIVDSSREHSIARNILPILKSALARADHRAHLEIEIRKAHVICCVYAIDNSNSFNRIPTYWLPYIRSLGVNVSCNSSIQSVVYVSKYPRQIPVILVGNKIDLRGGEVTNEALEDEIEPIMAEFKVHITPSDVCTVVLTYPNPRKWKHASSVLRKRPSTSQRSSTLLRKQCYIPPHHFMTLENTSVNLQSTRITLTLQIVPQTCLRGRFTPNFQIMRHQKRWDPRC